MYGVDLYRRVQLACHHEGFSSREAERRFGVDCRTVKKMLSSLMLPGYRRLKPVRRPLIFLIFLSTPSNARTEHLVDAQARREEMGCEAQGESAGGTQSSTTLALEGRSQSAANRVPPNSRTA